MSSESIAAYPLWLQSLLQGPHALAADARCVETHISWVVLAGERVFKFKKPLSLGFLDFGTLALRRHACEEELRINRRTAPQLYEAVIALLAPADEAETRMALTTAFRHDGPVAVRYPRGSGVGTVAAAGNSFETLPWGRGEIRRESGLVAGRPGSKRVAILAFGTMLYPALAAAEKLDATVANMRFVKPLDGALVEQLARTHDALVTIEEGCTMGGAGSAVAEHLNAAGITVPMLHLGLPDRFIEHGDPAFLLAQCGLDAAGIEAAVQQRYGQFGLLRPVANA